MGRGGRSPGGTERVGSSRLTRAAAALAALVLLSACDNGIFPGTRSTPGHLAALDPAGSLRGSVYLAQGGRVWRLRKAQVTALTPAGQSYAYPAVSGDGQVTAASLIGRGQAQIVVGGPDFANLAQLTPSVRDPHRGSIDLKPALSPDGRRMAFMSDRSQAYADQAIWEGPVRRRAVQLTCPPDQSGGDDAPAYLVDSSAVVFSSWRIATSGPPESHASLRELPIPGRTCGPAFPKSRPLIEAQGQDFLDPAPGPGGNLAFVHRKGDSANIEVADRDGGGATAVTSFGDVRQPVWSQDGNTLLFISPHAGSFDLWMIDAAGKNQPQRLTWGADIDANSRPAWAGSG